MGLMAELDLDKDNKISLAEAQQNVDGEATEEEKSHAEKIFKAADKNGDGFVDAEELPEAMMLTQTASFDEKGEDADEASEADVDAEDHGDEQMSAEELMGKLDLDKDNKISLAEVWQNFDDEDTEEEKSKDEKIFKAADKNGDGF